MHTPVPPTNQTHSDVRFDAPRLSENRSANVWLLPLAEAGVTSTALTPGGTDGAGGGVGVGVGVGVGGGGVGVGAGPLAATVQTPRSCQPLDSPLLPFANSLTVFDPLNADVNPTARFNVNSAPLTDTELAATPIEQELFWSVVLLPSTCEFQAVPSSFTRYS